MNFPANYQAAGSSSDSQLYFYGLLSAVGDMAYVACWTSSASIVMTSNEDRKVDKQPGSRLVLKLSYSIFVRLEMRKYSRDGKAVFLATVTLILCL